MRNYYLKKHIRMIDYVNLEKIWEDAKKSHLEMYPTADDFIDMFSIDDPKEVANVKKMYDAMRSKEINSLDVSYEEDSSHFQTEPTLIKDKGVTSFDYDVIEIAFDGAWETNTESGMDCGGGYHIFTVNIEDEDNLYISEYRYESI